MEHRKCPYLPELTKVTRIHHADGHDQELSSGKIQPLAGSDGVENGQIRRTISLEAIPERMIRRTPQVSSLRDFPPPAAFNTRSRSDVPSCIPVMPKLNNRVMEKLTQKRIQSWSTSFLNLLKDHVGTQLFLDFLEKEFSAENLRFWLACQELKDTKRKSIEALVNEIFKEFFLEESLSMINIDSKTLNHVKINLTNPSYNIFDSAEEHIFQLMKADSYPRFIRSEKYKQVLKDCNGNKMRKSSSSAR